MNITRICRRILLGFAQVALPGLICISPLWGSELVKTIEYSKPSIVGVGTFQKTRSPPLNFLGTGFVVDDGLHVITNAHVVPEVLDAANKESYTVITGKGKEPELRDATVVAVDKEHDLALLRISGSPLCRQCDWGMRAKFARGSL